MAGPSLQPQETDLYKIVAVIRWILAQLGTQPVGTPTIPALFGLKAANNASTPNTKMDIVFSEGLLRDTNKRAQWFANLSATLDYSAAGPVINGRDQAGAFTASSFVHVYAIGNLSGSLATIASLTDPSVGGPTLPNGYTLWAYLFTTRWNQNSQIKKTHIRDNVVFYDEVVPGSRILEGGTATSSTAVSTAPYVPSIAGWVFLFDYMFCPGGTADVAQLQLTSGVKYIDRGYQAGGFTTSQNVIPNVNQNVYYFVTGTGAYWMYITGYTVPNGGA